MPRALLAVSLLCLLFVPGAARPEAQAPAAVPRLVVVVVVDQLRTDYLDLGKGYWRAGMARLLGEGALFANAEYPYLNTVTCAGHTTIGTGTFPRTHGQVLNGWWDRARKASVTCTEDAESKDVTYGREARLTNSGKPILVPTLADELRAQRPGSRVVTLSLKARSAIGLAGHGGDAVTWVDDGAAGFVTSAAFAPAPVPAVAAHLKEHPPEADAGKLWALRDAVQTYRFPDASLGARPTGGRSGLFPHRVTGPKKTDAPFFSLWQTSPYSDAYLARAAIALVDAFALGQRSGTDFLGVSFSALDLVGHGFGPESREVEDMLRHLDDSLGLLLAHLDARVGRGNWVLGFSSDHGVAPIAYLNGGGRIITEDIRDRIEEALITRYGPRTDGTYVGSVTFNYVYFTEGVFERLTKDPPALAAVERAALSVPGVARVLRGSQLSAASADRVVRAAALSHVPGRSGDLVLVGRENWYFSPRADGSATTHGTWHPYDRRVPVLMMGAAITPGTYSSSATPADIAPTLAQLAGVKLPKAEGRVLREALR
jgi:predicted AlkP superfamily pyrophosphatase or phosphodiesterase